MKPRTNEVLVFFRLRFSLLSISALVFLAGFSAATPIITEFTVTDNQVIFVVEGLAQDQQAQIQMDDDLELFPAVGSLLPGAVATNLGNGSFRITAPRPASPRLFFRAIAANLGTAADLDGDGLPNTFETLTLGTDPNLADSDSDGFSDGLEFSSGTNPLSDSDFPDLLSLPTVAFELGMSPAIEGEGTHLLEIRSEPPYTGPIFYSVNDRSTAVESQDFSLPAGNSVLMTNGVAQLPITLIDDMGISPERLILIDLDKNPPGGFYRAAGAVLHVTCLSDNDSYWTGVAVDNTTQRNFRMRLLRNGSTTEWSFVAGNEDGLPTEAADGSDLMGSSQSTGLIPDFDFDDTAPDGTVPRGVWEAVASTFTLGTPASPGIFAATSPQMPVSSGGFINAPLQRVLALTGEVQPFFRLLDPPNLTPRATEPSEPLRLSGSYVETISHATDPAITYLNSTINGSFVLTRVANDQATISSAYDVSGINN